MEEMAWFIPPLIFLARICDVSIGTVRTILVIAGHRWISAALGFVEVIIWALAVGGVIKFLTYPSALVAYAAGFAAGTLAGMTIERHLAIGFRMIRVINAKPELHVAASLREHGYRVTRVDGVGKDGPVEIAFSVVKRRQLPKAMALIEKVAPGAFVTVERTDRAANATTDNDPRVIARFLANFGLVRK